MEDYILQVTNATIPQNPHDQGSTIELELLEGGMIMCRSVNPALNYDLEQCNLEFNWAQGDTVAFTVNSVLYESQIKRFITPFII